MAEVYRHKVEHTIKVTGLPADLVLSSPTLIAVDGLTSAFQGDHTSATRAADRLVADAVPCAGGRLFSFSWDYETVWPYKLRAPWPSALTQGLGLALLNALAATSRPGERFDVLADEAARAFLVPVADGGFMRRCAEGVILEEYPVRVSTAVLNGGAFATLALVDYLRRRPDAALSALLRDARRWWAGNIDRYTVESETYRCAVSAYSLAPQRPELLFRLLSDVPVQVDRISFIRASGPVAQIDVGDPSDTDQQGQAYLWFNPAFQNWSEPLRSGEVRYREIRPCSGSYNHAPFSLALDPEEDARGLHVEIVATIPTTSTMSVQVYDGTDYHAVGDVMVGGRDDKGLYRLPVPPEAVTQFLVGMPAHPPVHPAYFADNQVLVRLLGEALDLPHLTGVAEGWRSSADLTPPEFDAR